MKCRSCGHGSFGDVIDLGLMPLVNNLLESSSQACPRWPLQVVFCRACSLAQLTESPPPGEMFDHYLYFSSQSQTMLAHAANLVRRFVKPGQRVLEIASNDGYLLSQAKRNAGADVLGIDPAKNIAAHANRNGVPTRCDYFNERLGKSIAQDWGLADVIFANNVLAHVPDPNQIAAGIKHVLAPGGIAHIESPSLTQMIENTAFDTIYHEHHSYFSLTALKVLFNRHGLRVIDIELMDIHGGSLHVQVAHDGDEVVALKSVHEEHHRGVLDDAFYVDFASRVNTLGEALHRIIDQHELVVGYGAAAKGVVLLNRFGLDETRIPWVTDVSPHKIGRFIPGTRQAIVSPAMLMSAHPHPDAALLLPWNLTEEIVQRNTAYLNQGGRFIVPIPDVRVIHQTPVAVQT